MLWALRRGSSRRLGQQEGFLGEVVLVPTSETLAGSEARTPCCQGRHRIWQNFPKPFLEVTLHQTQYLGSFHVRVRNTCINFPLKR